MERRYRSWRVRRSRSFSKRAEPLWCRETGQSVRQPDRLEVAENVFIANASTTTSGLQVLVDVGEGGQCLAEGAADVGEVWFVIATN